jgi:lysophospholipase L1-like esterase
MAMTDEGMILRVDSAAAKFSPGNWKGDAGRSGDLHRQSWNNGAWCSFTWRAAVETPEATLLLARSATGRISYFLNGQLTDGVHASGEIAISGIAAGVDNTLVVYLRNSDQHARWNDGDSNVRVLGLRIDGLSSPGIAPPARPWVLLVGDSITEGIEAQNGADNFLYSYSFHLSRAFDQLGFDIGVSACGFSGWLRPGDVGGDVPAYYMVADGVYEDGLSRWNKIDEGVSLLDEDGRISAYGGKNSGPEMILINYGTNDAICGCSRADVEASVTQALAALRQAAPGAVIGMIVPFGLESDTVFSDGPSYAASLRAGVADYRAAFADDDGVMLFDFGADFARMVTREPFANPNGIHPDLLGHAQAGATLAARCAAVLAGGKVTRRRQDR